MSETDSTANDSPRIDWISAIMAITASLLLGLGAYGWFMRARADIAKPERPAVATVPPPLHLVDPVTGESVVLVGLQGKVVWVSFISAASKTTESEYASLTQVWKRLHLHQMFAMAVVASPTDSRDVVKALTTKSSETFPTYIASEETAAAFGVNPSNLPFHMVVDPSGKVAAIGGEGMIERLARDATQWLDQIEPTGWTRFAQAR